MTDEEPQATLEAEPEPMPASGLEPIPISELDPVTDEELQAMSAPAPAPASAEGPVEDPMLDLPQPLTPEERARAQRYRRAGVITMGFGGAITALGAVFAIGHTLRGKGLREEWRFAEERFTAANCSRFPQKERCPILGAIVTGLDRKAEQAQRGSQRGGIAILSGIAVIAVGGVIYRIGVKRLQARELALSPSLGGAVLHGRF